MFNKKPTKKTAAKKGRPRKEPDELREIPVTFHVSQEERKALKDYEKSMGIPLNNCLRLMLRDKVPGFGQSSIKAPSGTAPIGAVEGTEKPEKGKKAHRSFEV